MNDKLDLRICIIGAGVGGIATALALARAGFQNIDLFERSETGAFVGAGIQLPPNMMRILNHLGVGEEVRKDAVSVNRVCIKQTSNDEEVGHLDVSCFESTYGSPWLVGHRSSLVDALQKGCNQHSAIRFHFCHKAEVTSFTPHPSIEITPQDATMPPHSISADIVLAADGVKSSTRTSLLNALNTSTSIIETNQSAYRILLRRDQLTPHPDLLALIDANTVTRWIGTKKHIIAYPISNNQIYNIATFQPDTNFASAPSATYTTKGSKTAMMARFADFCPKLRALLDLVPEGEVCEWRLRVHAPLPTWVHGSVALLGDACHPMVPHVAQGAAQAIEDAAVLAVVLARMPDFAEGCVNRALKVYEIVRKERAEKLVELAAASGKMLMESEAEAIERRDRELKAMGSGESVPDKWLDRGVQDMMYLHDCVEVAEEVFEGAFAALENSDIGEVDGVDQSE